MSAYHQTPNPLYICEPGQGTSSSRGKKLLDLYRESLRVRHYSYRTEETYISWVRQFILFLYRHVLDIQLSEHRQFATL